MNRITKLLALLLAALAILTFTACGGNADANKDSSAASGENKADPSETPDTASGTSDTPSETPAESKYTDALSVLDAIWSSYADDDKFPVLGGNRDAMVDSAPGKFDLSAAEELTGSLLLPAENIAGLKSAASLIHMMNANTFTSAVFQTDGDLDTLSKTLVDAANTRQFICGAPQMIVTLKLDNYVIMAFGADDLIATFKTKALTIEGVSLIHEGPITFTGGNTGDGGFGGIVIPF